MPGGYRLVTSHLQNLADMLCHEAFTIAVWRLYDDDPAIRWHSRKLVRSVVGARVYERFQYVRDAANVPEDIDEETARENLLKWMNENAGRAIERLDGKVEDLGDWWK